MSNSISIKTVPVAEGLEMAETVVTQQQWVEVMGALPEGIDEYRPDHPVVYVSYNDIQEFLQRLCQKTGETFRLPTEDEWEDACRAGAPKEWDYHFGDDVEQLGEYAWFRDNADELMPVKQKKPNALGLYDMHGNVWEFTSSFYVAQDWNDD